MNNIITESGTKRTIGQDDIDVELSRFMAEMKLKHSELEHAQAQQEKDMILRREEFEYSKKQQQRTWFWR